MTALPVSDVLDDAWPVAEVEAAAHELLDRTADRMALIGPRVELVDVLRDAVGRGGKRLRPAFCHWGHVCVDGLPPAEDGVRLGAALELLHTFALVHDDVMDESATRRGGSTVHARYAARHRFGQLHGDRRRYAESMAILVGDLAFSMANEVVSSLAPSVQRLWFQMCDELVLGQYLDLDGAATASRSSAYASRVAVLKSGRYTVVRPLQLGAVLAGGDISTLDALATYGEPLGEAFQLCDDLLDGFGDPVKTGKPIGADLRAGKPTVLLALLSEAAPASAAALLDRVGTPELSPSDVADVLALAVRTGARAEVERRVAESAERARSATDHPALHPAARPALLALADRATCRVR